MDLIRQLHGCLKNSCWHVSSSWSPWSPLDFYKISSRPAFFNYKILLDNARKKKIPIISLDLNSHENINEHLTIKTKNTSSIISVIET